MSFSAKVSFRLWAGAASLLLLIVLAVSSAAAQSATPTPRVTPTPTAAQSSAPLLGEPFTQSDLTVLTGNVQRPNGITWLNGQLYVACSGDWTVYEVNAEDGRTITYAGGLRNAHTLYAEIGDNNMATMYAPDFDQNRVSMVTRGQALTIAEGDAFSGPWGISYVDDETFAVSNLLGNDVVVVTREGETRVAIDGLAAPTGLMLNGDVLYVANNGSTRRAVEWYPAAVLEADAEPAEGEPLVSGIQSTTGLAMDGDGLLYLAYSLGTRGVVGRVNPQMCMDQGGCTQEDVEVVLVTELAAPLAGLTIAPNGRLYVHTMFAPDIYWVQLPE